MSTRAILYAGSIALHVGLALGVGSIERKKKHETIAIAVHEVAKKPEPAKIVDPEPPKPEAHKAAARAPQQAKAAPAPAPEAPAAPAAAGLDALPDFGLSLSGGSGSGLAVAAPGGASKAAPKSSAPPKARVLAPKADECDEPAGKPKPIQVVQPAYTQDARDAQIEGKVRVEITVDADGNVTAVRLVSGLGHGLDDAALAAARSSRFEPAKRCGRGVSSTFTLGMRFSL